MSAQEELIERLMRAARAGGASEFDIATLRLHVLERLRLETLHEALRVKYLEQSMSSSDPGERCEAICARVGISRRRYYELKKIASAIPDRTPAE